MNFISNKLRHALVSLGCVMLLGACSDSTPVPEDNDGPNLNESPVVMFHISTLNAGASSGSEVTELINTLRIIMIHESGSELRIEANRLIDTHQADNNFNYMFQKRTLPGKKRIYLIANEQSVKRVELVSGSFPAVMQNPDLKTVLDYYEPDLITDGTEEGTATIDKEYSAADFEEVLTSLCFEGDGAYEINGGVVCLPYSAFYDDIEVHENEKIDNTEKPMYLVPAATKFTFKFINERTAGDVAVDYLALASTQKTNYLMANLEDQELNKYIGGQKYYWIDWLKYVVDETQANPDLDDNVPVNGMYGWISGYNVPVPEDVYEHYFVPDGQADDPENAPAVKSTSWMLKGAVEENGRITGTEAEFGPLYIPEGHHVFDEEETDEETGEVISTQTVEKYLLKIKLRNSEAPVDSKSLVDVKIAESEISNLKALFRNTSVFITITLHEGGVNIYAEPVPWNKKVFFGYVKDEDEIK